MLVHFKTSRELEGDVDSIVAGRRKAARRHHVQHLTDSGHNKPASGSLSYICKDSVPVEKIKCSSVARKSYVHCLPFCCLYASGGKPFHTTVHSCSGEKINVI